ncbi:MAG: PulJ/GspJ family protein [Acidimicrobiales bacterium]
MDVRRGRSVAEEVMSRSRSRLSKGALGEESGFSVAEVVLALVIILIALVATSQVLTSTTEAVVNQQQLNSARGLLSSTVQAELTAESQASSTTFPVDPNPAPPLTVAAAWPSTPTSTQTVSGFKFNVYQVWGWCAPTSGSSPVMSTYNGYVRPYAPPYPVYEMAVKVTWRSNYPSSISQVTEIPLPPSQAATYSYPASSSNCPAGLK